MMMSLIIFLILFNDEVVINKESKLGNGRSSFVFLEKICAISLFLI